MSAGTRDRWWRWRRNPLRSRSYLVEAWANLLIALAVLVGMPTAAFVAGSAAYDHARAQAVMERATRRPVQAEVVARVPQFAYAKETDPAKVVVTVRWKDSTGTPRTGTVSARRGTTRGDGVRIWLDERGRIASAPMGGQEITTRACCAGSEAAVLVALGAVSLHVAVRSTMQRRRLACWEREWRQVGPQWDIHRT
ncbi:Rv1733c family protein [Streptomyces sp. NPDC002004]